MLFRSPHRYGKSNWLRSGSPRQNKTTARGKTEMKKDKKIRVKQGSGNVFADLGFPNPEREQLRARLTLQIYRVIKRRGLTQVAAGEILGIKQPHVSGLMRGQSGNFSVERLMDFLTAQGTWRGFPRPPVSRRQRGCPSCCSTAKYFPTAAAPAPRPAPSARARNGPAPVVPGVGSPRPAPWCSLPRPPPPPANSTEGDGSHRDRAACG